MRKEYIIEKIGLRAWEEMDWRGRMACAYMLFVIAAFCAAVAISPPCDDDFIYRSMFHDYLLDGGSFPTLKRLIKQYVYFYLNINSRFGDHFLFLLELSPQWLYTAISTLTISGIFALMMKISGISFRKNPYKVIGMVTLFVLFLPWYDTWMARAVFWNYFPAIFLSLFAIRIFADSLRNCKGATEKAFTSRGKIGLLFMGFLAGAWHEEHAAALGICLIIYLFAVRRLTARQKWLVAGGALGVIYQLTSPGNYVRLTIIDKFAKQFWMWQTKWGLAFCLIIIAAAIVGLWRGKKSGEGKPATMPLVWGMWASVALAAVITTVITGEGRLFFLPCTLCIIALLCCLPREWKCAAWKKAVISIVAIAITTAHMSAVVVVDWRQRSDYEEMCRLMRTAENPREIYFDASCLRNGHWLALNKHFGRTVMREDFLQFELPFYLSITHSEVFSFIDPKLRDFNPKNLKPVEGYPGIYLYQNKVFLDDPWQNERMFSGTILLETADFMSPLFTHFNSVQVRDCNGHYWFYLELEYRLFDNCRKIIGIQDIQTLPRGLSINGAREYILKSIDQLNEE